MADMACHGCNEIIDDEQLLCPLCGAATIPQLTKTELHGLNERRVRRGLFWTRWFTGLGYATGVGISAAAMVRDTRNFSPDNILSGLFISAPCFAVLAGLIGAVVDVALARIRK